MPMQWHQITAGSYDPTSKQSGLDYKRLLHDPVAAQTTLCHETTHSILMASTDFGQTTNVLYALEREITKIPKEKYQQILNLIYNYQFQVQEGFATLMELLRLANITNKRNALDYAKNNLLPQYQEAVEPLLFAFDMSSRYRDNFTARISWLSLETGIRRDIVENNLLSDPDKFQEYLDEDDKNPNKRLFYFAETIRKNFWLATKDDNTIARQAGVTLFKPTNKEEAATFLEYVSSFTSHPHHFLASDIGDVPQDGKLISDALENTYIANINLNLVENGKVLFDFNEFMKMSDNFEIVVLSPQEQNDDLNNFIKQITGEKPDVGVLAFCKNGESYLTALTKEKAKNIINNELKDCTFLVKWGGYDVVNDRIAWMADFRPPELVVYNFPKDILKEITYLLDKFPDTKFKHLHLGSSENHPFQSLFIRIESKTPIHVVNAYGNKLISEVINTIGQKTTVFDNEELKSSKKHINNLMSLWMGMPWEIDWVETMIDGKNLHYRQQ